MPYTPSNHILVNKPLGYAQAVPTDARSYFYNTLLFKYRPYQSVAEVLSYLDTPTKRGGSFDIYVCDGVLGGDGVFVGGTITKYWFKDGVTDEDLVEAGSGGGVSLVSVTYDELQTLISTSALVPGQKYLITDYQTVHYMIDSSDHLAGDPINTGPIEPLIVESLTTSTLSHIAKSTVYPQDIIYIHFDLAKVIKDKAYALDFTTPVPGFKGLIYYREDTYNRNVLGYDFRSVKFRRYALNASMTWSAATSYAKGAMVLHNGIVYKSNIAANLNQAPNSFPYYWHAVLTVSHFNGYPMTYSTARFGMTSDASSYIDVTTFAMFGSGSYEIGVHNNRFETVRDDEDVWNNTGTVLQNNVFWVSNSWMSIYDNNFGAYFTDNTMCDYTEGNNFTGEYMYQNIMGQAVRNNRVGGVCTNNVIRSNFSENSIENHFENNTIGDYFFANRIFGSTFSSNHVSSSFIRNVCTAEFLNNYVVWNCTSNMLSYFSGNHIGVPFTKNVLLAEFTNNTIAYNAAKTFQRVSSTAKITGKTFTGLIVFTSHQKELITSINETLFLRYLEDAGTQTIAPWNN